ncbi:hypothetical protein GALMADRAFT_250463 [Galerina marginata CBS 339.88]|uniref:JmjC domain-containing protein n=1 Tax=Galerina marginata (strain CBS 339.88) TaxID=685588 RepID=A0A067T3K9_GALM3|nr:hypothetical protein GALMADRAFT_250463 [Galerina marginata CBS 339.88]
MNALQDPSKKTSITSLLNPQEASAFPAHLTGIAPAPLVPNHVQSQVQYEPVYGHSASFNLRAASWETEASATRKANSPQLHQQYQHQQSHPTMLVQPPSNTYAYPTEMPRTRMDDSQGYAEGGPVWQPQRQQADSSRMSYGHVQSNERTALNGDYSNQNSYSSSYEGNGESSVWQTSPRASVRIVAMGTAPPTSQTTHDQRYAQGFYYNHHNIYDHPSESYSSQNQITVPASSTQPHPEPVRNSGSSSSSKRQLPEGEAAPPPKAKRSKAKAKETGPETPTTTPGTSKRGYNAKKRSEAAFISAQNDALQKAQRNKESEGYRSQTDPEHSATTMTDSMAFIPELQFARCMSNRYKKEEFPRCVSCTRRWAGDTCRFQGIRYFMRDAQRNLRGISFTERNSVTQVPIMDFPTRWNRKFEEEHIRRIKLSIAKDLLPTLLAEQDHLKSDEIVRRPRECDVRATCDTCMTSLFSTSFMCRLCGREVCKDCFQLVVQLTHQPPGVGLAVLNSLVAKREKYTLANPFFLACTKRNEHGASEFTPVTRFVGAELDKALKEMQSIMGKEKESQGAKEVTQTGRSMGDPGPSVAESRSSTTVDDDQTQSYSSSQNALDTTSSTEPQIIERQQAPTSPDRNIRYWDDNINTANFPDPVTEPVYDNYTPSNAPPHTTAIPIYRLQVIPVDLYDPPPQASKPPPVFSSLWSQGYPLLVKGVLPRFKVKWNPAYFMERYGDQTCLVVECQTDTNRRIPVKDFFGWFGAYQDRKECLKLKDWPPTAEFKTAFPELYEDFSQAVPVPDYVRRDGVYNIGSHFPSNAVGPDLGPKMYNSMASSQEAGSKGSTRLHMDMADALNVMLHAEPCEDGTEGYAVWDLFRAEDSDKIRAFLKRKFGFGQPAPNVANAAVPSSTSGSSKSAAAAGPAPPVLIGHDPIHGQQFYLDVELRQAIWEESGVRSFRVYQRPGDGVFIPAGCAHQVANMSDCMKVAIDFVSPENIERCEKLTKEFREQNQSKVWKEDVLQLRTMMWFAWQSCCIQEEELAKEKAASTGSNNAMDTDTGTGRGDPKE